MKRVSLILILACVFLPVRARAQAQTGTPPFASFSGSPDVIDLGNLNVHLTIPVFHKPGRGLNFAYDITYDSAVWYPIGSGSTREWTSVPNWGWQGASGLVSPHVGMLELAGVPCYDNGILGGETGQKYTYFWSYTDQAAITTWFGSTTGGWGTCQHQSVQITSLNNTVNGYIFSASGSEFLSLYNSKGASLNVPVNSQSFLTPITTDRNGNEITYNNGIVDTFGDTVLTESGVVPNPVVFSYSAPTATGKVTVNYTSYTVATNFGVSGIGEFGRTAEPLVSSIVLADGSQYTIQYEATPNTPSSGACTPLSGTYSANCVTARIASVKLPTGGTITYEYSGGNNGVLPDGTAATLQRKTPDGTWIYARTLGSGSASTNIVTDPAGNDTVIQFQGIYETQRQVYKGSHTSGTLLETTNTCYNGSALPCTSTAITLPITQRTVTKQYGTNGMKCEHVTDWNAAGSMTEQDDYDYGNGTVGPLIRKKLIAYASLGNITGFKQTVTTETIANGNIASSSQTTYNYDETSVTSSSGTPNHISVSGSRGNLTSIVYSTQGSSTLKKSFTYYDTGRLNTSIDVNLATTTYQYPDATSTCGNTFATKVIEPISGLSQSMTWNCTGGVETSVTDENGQKTTYTYNDPYYWRINATSDPENNTTNFTYASPTSVEATLNFNSGNSTVDLLTTLDGLGRTHLSQKRQSPTATMYDSVETDYDSSGRVERTTPPYGGTMGQLNGSGGTTVTYDALNRRLVTTMPSANGNGTITRSYTGNDASRVLGPAPTGENTKQRQFEYNSIGQLTSVCEITSLPGAGTCGQTVSATGYWTKYTYDALGDLLSVTQNAQSSTPQTRTYTYDEMGRMTSETNPESSTTTYTYDSASGTGCASSSPGNLIKITDAAGNWTCYDYDALHRVTDVGNSNQSATNSCKRFRYDDSQGVLGQRPSGVTVNNGMARVVEAETDDCLSPFAPITDEWFSYSPRGEVATFYESTPHSGGYYTASATYWANGVLDGISASTGYSNDYNVDGEGRVYSTGNSNLTQTSYNSASEPTAVTFGSGDGDTFTYDPNTFRMTQYKFSMGATQSVVGNLTWNANGALGQLAITDPFDSTNTQTCNYTHDDLARIASANCGSVWSQTFSYDAFGNITKAGTNSFNPGYNTATNRMSTGATYDSDGDVLTDSLHSYAWDVYNQPTTIDSVSVTYDALGRAVEQTNSGTSTEIQYSPTGFKMQVLNGQIAQNSFVPMPAGTTAVWASGSTLYYQDADWLGSARFASKPDHTMYNDLAYAPFGEQYEKAGNTGVGNVSFAGNNEGTTTNLYDAQNREYEIYGRWPSPDPAGLSAAHLRNPQTLNRYAYVAGRPLESTDPTGMDDCDSLLGECCDDDGNCWDDGGGGGGDGEGGGGGGGSSCDSSDPSCGGGDSGGCDPSVDPTCGGGGCDPSVDSTCGSDNNCVDTNDCGQPDTPVCNDTNGNIIPCPTDPTCNPTDPSCVGELPIDPNHDPSLALLSTPPDEFFQAWEGSIGTIEDFLTLSFAGLSMVGIGGGGVVGGTLLGVAGCADVPMDLVTCGPSLAAGGFMVGGGAFLLYYSYLPFVYAWNMIHKPK